MGNQSSFDLGEPRQGAIEFPTSLAVKYQPSIENFIGLGAAKQVVAGLIKKPRPINLLFIGETGTGKTVMGMNLAEALGATLHHLRAQKSDVDTLENVWHECHYMPSNGVDKFHVVLIDECDSMTDKAQLQWLSYGDGAAALTPLWGGVTRGVAPRIIWIGTCNGIGKTQTNPPLVFEKKFLSRFVKVPFERPSTQDAAPYLRAIWEKEGGVKGAPLEFFRRMSTNVALREALNNMEGELLAARSLKELKAECAKADPAEGATPFEEMYAFLIPSERERAIHLEKRSANGQASAAEKAQLRTYRSWQTRYANKAELATQ